MSEESTNKKREDVFNKSMNNIENTEMRPIVITAKKLKNN